MSKSIALIGYASGIAAGDPGCGDGPMVLQHSNLAVELGYEGLMTYWEEILQPIPELTKLATIADICNRLAQCTARLAQEKKLFTVFGGDHSSAIGTWSGLASAYRNQGSIGLVWIDAHLDSHTPETTPSGNIHGMPVAALLGYGAPELTHIMDVQPKIKPENLSLIGIRSFEIEEAELLKRLNVRIYNMDEVQQRGIEVILQEAIVRAKLGTAGYGLSIDIDSIDPNDAPGTGVPEPNGIHAQNLKKALRQLQHDEKLLGVEIAEFDPHHDHNHKTQKIIKELLLSIF